MAVRRRFRGRPPGTVAWACPIRCRYHRKSRSARPH